MLMLNRIADEILVATGHRPANATTPSPREDRDMAEQIKQLKDWASTAENFIATHPGASLAAALGVGIVLGWWMKRT